MLGDVTLGPRASVWYQAVLRGDTAPIVVGEASNVQDGTIIHADEGLPATIGARVGVGHRVVLHGCTVDEDCLIGMGSVLLNGVHIGAGSVVAAGAVVPEGLTVPPGSVVMGVDVSSRAHRFVMCILEGRVGPQLYRVLPGSRAIPTLAFPLSFRIFQATLAVRDEPV